MLCTFDICGLTHCINTIPTVTVSSDFITVWWDIANTKSDVTLQHFGTTFYCDICAALLLHTTSLPILVTIILTRCTRELLWCSVVPRWCRYLLLCYKRCMLGHSSTVTSVDGQEAADSQCYSETVAWSLFGLWTNINNSEKSNSWHRKDHRGGSLLQQRITLGKHHTGMLCSNRFMTLYCGMSQLGYCFDYQTEFIELLVIYRPCPHRSRSIFKLDLLFLVLAFFPQSTTKNFKKVLQFG